MLTDLVDGINEKERGEEGEGGEEGVDEESEDEEMGGSLVDQKEIPACLSVGV